MGKVTKLPIPARKTGRLKAIHAIDLTLAEARAVLTKLGSEVQSTPSMPGLQIITAQVIGIQKAFANVKDVADKAGEVWIAAEARLGEEWEAVDKAKGTKGLGRPKIGGLKVNPPKDIPTIAEYGLDKNRLRRARLIKAVSAAKREKFIEELKEAGRGVTPNALLSAVRKRNKEAKRHAISKAKFSATGPFDVVVIDPPWEMQKIDRDVRPNQDAFDYPVMTEAQLLEFWPEEIVSKLSNDCHVFCWTTQRFLPSALRLVEGWGLKYVLVMVWHKPGGFQPVDMPQYNCEFVVYARKGSPIFIDTKDFPCCFDAPRREHSRKPKYFYELVRRVTGGSRIDVFSREKHEGYAQFGNEIDKFNEAAE